MDEEWRDIDDYPDYEVSNLGQVRSTKMSKHKLLLPIMTHNGYLITKLINDQKIRKNLFVHRIVAIAFVENPKPDDYDVVDHINSVKNDNRVENLQWLNQSLNMKKAKRGLGTSRAVLLKKDGIELTFTSIVNASNHFKVNQCTLYRALKRKTFQDYSIEYNDEPINFISDNTAFINLNYKKITDVYEISIKGIIRRKDTKRILKSCMLSGYPTVQLNKNKIHYSVGIHRLLALSFVPGRTEEKCFVNHIDENKLNYNIDNLQWCTIRENTIHSAYKQFKKVMQYDLKTNEIIQVYDSIKNAAESVGCIASKISLCCKGTRKKTGGFGWKYYTEDIEPI